VLGLAGVFRGGAFEKDFWQRFFMRLVSIFDGYFGCRGLIDVFDVGNNCVKLSSLWMGSGGVGASGFEKWQLSGIVTRCVVVDCITIYDRKRRLPCKSLSLPAKADFSGSIFE
jgi:hypothetical protein